MTTPTTMTTSMITTATTMMTNVVVAPSLGGLLVGCVLLLTGTVLVVVTLPTVWGEMVCSEIDAVERKRTKWCFKWNETQNTKHKNVLHLRLHHATLVGHCIASSK